MPTGVYDRKKPVMTPEERKALNNVRQKAYSQANPQIGRNTKLKKNYGITVKQYDEWHDACGGLCNICGKPETIKDKRSGKTRKLAVDHDKNTRLVRGLLCSKCNRGIGMLMHDSTILTEAIDYIDYFNNITVPGVNSAINEIA